MIYHIVMRMRHKYRLYNLLYFSIFFLYGCSSSENSEIDKTIPPPPNTSPTISNIVFQDINGGELIKNDLIQVSYSYSDLEGDDEGNSIIQWYRDGNKIEDSNNLEYIIKADDRGSIIKIGIIPVAVSGNNNFQEYYEEIYIPMIEANDRWKKEKWVLNNDLTLNILTGFDGPYGISTFDNKIYVSDLFDHKVIILSPNFKFDLWIGYSFDQNKLIKSEDIGTEGRYSFENPPFGKLSGPHAVDFSIDKKMYVADFFGKNISVFDESLDYLYNLSMPDNNNLYFNGPANIYTCKITGDIFISEWIDNRIFIFDRFENFKGWLGKSKDNNDFLKNYGIPLQSDDIGGFFKPHMVVVDDLENIFIADQANNRIQKFSSSYEPLGIIGYDQANDNEGWSMEKKSTPTSSLEGFNQPLSISIKDDNLIITDHGNFRILKYTIDGIFVGWIGGTIENPVLKWSTDEYQDEINYDNALLKAPYDAKYINDILLVADGHRKHILVLNPDDS